MKEFEFYSPEDTIASNLNEDAKRFSFLTEQELSHLYDLAHEIVQDRDVQEILISLQEQKAPKPSIPRDTLSQNRDIVSRAQKNLESQRTRLLCCALCNLLQSDRQLSFDTFFQDAVSQPISSTPRIIYQKSVYADSAYLHFSSCFEEAASAYTHSFISACEEVYNGLCDYCILPLENSSEGLLISFVKLILRYDLKIAATCDVYEGREHRVTKFALLRKGIVPVFSHMGGDMFFELALPLSESIEPSEILSAARFFGLSATNVTYVPFIDSKQPRMLHSTFSINQGEPLEPFLIYLCMEAPNYLPLGLYPHMTSKK